MDFARHLKEKGWFEITTIAMDERPMKAMQKACLLYTSGYKNENLVDVILLISQVMVTNFVNNITHNKIDFPEAPAFENES